MEIVDDIVCVDAACGHDNSKGLSRLSMRPPTVCPDLVDGRNRLQQTNPFPETVDIAINTEVSVNCESGAEPSSVQTQTMPYVQKFTVDCRTLKTESLDPTAPKSNDNTTASPGGAPTTTEKLSARDMTYNLFISFASMIDNVDEVRTYVDLIEIRRKEEFEQHPHAVTKFWSPKLRKRRQRGGAKVLLAQRDCRSGVEETNRATAARSHDESEQSKLVLQMNETLQQFRWRRGFGSVVEDVGNP